MKDARTLLIIGAGLAGAKAAEGARASGHQGRIVLVGQESRPPYERPPLSKAVLRGEAGLESSRVHEAGFYIDNAIELVTGDAVESVDVESRKARLSGGETIGFDTAVLATGAAPRRLELPGADLDGVHYLRTVDDCARLQDVIAKGARVAVIGGGWIGSEVAASAREMGAEVLLVEPAPFPLHRLLGDTVGAVFSQLHADHGVALRMGVGVNELRGGKSVEQVVLSDGRIEAADLVVAGIGVIPRLELAIAAGLDVDNGVVVDENLRTSAPNVFAAGDIANAWHPHYHRHLRVEHWANALNQGGAAGANATREPEPYMRLPYFFSDQYDLGLEYIGFSVPDDQVVIRGDVDAREFIAFYHRDGVISAAMNVNVWDVIDDLRAVVAGGRIVDMTRLSDPSVPLAEFTTGSLDAAARAT